MLKNLKNKLIQKSYGDASITLIGMFFTLLVTFVFILMLQIQQINLLYEEIDEALALSVLSAAVINDEDAYSAQQIVIHELDKFDGDITSPYALRVLGETDDKYLKDSYEYYIQTFTDNFRLDTNLIPVNPLINSSISIVEYNVYNVWHELDTKGLRTGNFRICKYSYNPATNIWDTYWYQMNQEITVPDSLTQTNVPVTDTMVSAQIRMTVTKLPYIAGIFEDDSQLTQEVYYVRNADIKEHEDMVIDREESSLNNTVDPMDGQLEPPSTNSENAPFYLSIKSNIKEQMNDTINRDELIVTVYYKDGTSRVLENDEYTLTPEELNTSMNGNYEFTVKYVEDGVVLEKDFTVNVKLPDKFSAEVTEKTEGDTYTVSMKLSSNDVEIRRNEVIIMADASSSIKAANWGKMKEAMQTIGETVLDGQGYNVITIMGFGIDDNLVASQISTLDELETVLEYASDYMLYGRSSSNNEVGFTGVQEYIESNKEGLNKAYVIYITDGQTNMSEEPYKFYDAIDNADWHYNKLSAETIGKMLFTDYELYRIFNGGKAIAATYTYFNDYLDELLSLYEAGDSDAIDTILDTVGADGETALWRLWYEAYWTDVFEYAGLDIEEEYPVSVIERAFVTYGIDKECNYNGYELADALYYSILRMPHNVFVDTYKDATRHGLRASKACDALANMYEVAKVFLIDFNNKSDSWLNPNRATKVNSNGTALPYVTASNVEYYGVSGIQQIANALPNILPNILKTTYSDLTFVTNTSKWVELVSDSIKVYSGDECILEYDPDTNTCVWNIAVEDRSTNIESPITVEKVSSANNSNGDIYKISWRVRDGILLSTDDFYLEFNVTIDTDEPGFAYNNDYDICDSIVAYYTDSTGTNSYSEDIDVPAILITETQ